MTATICNLMSIPRRMLRMFVFMLSMLSAVMVMAEGGTTVHYDCRDGLSSHRVGGGVQDRNGLMWFATWNGLNCYDGYDFHCISIRPGDKASIGTNLIRDILLTPDGDILCHTDDDIYVFDLDTYSFGNIDEENKGLYVDKVGRRWRGLTDTQGCRWTADHNGIYKTFALNHLANVIDGTGDEHPRALMIDQDGQLWVGRSRHPGVDVYGPDGRITRSEELDAAPYCIYQTQNGDIWVGGKPGMLVRLGYGNVSDDSVYDIKEDVYGRLWVATFGDGIKCCANPQSSTPVLSGTFGGGKVRRILITPSGNLVAATNDGLLIGSISNRDLDCIKLRSVRRDGDRAGSLCSNSVMSIVQDSRGVIYVGTESSGIDVIGEDELFSDIPEFTHVNMRNSSLTGDVCKALAMYSDSLLVIVGRDNVMAYNPQSGHTVTMSETFWNDTCVFAEATPVRLGDGTWVVAAEQGAFAAKPDDIYSRGYVPPVVFTTMSVNGGAEEFCLPARDTVAMSAHERNVKIGFAALDYIDNSAILYRASVDGSPWTGAGRSRSVTLFNLTPGEHTLEVQSTDRYGRWVDNTRTIIIDVAPYWYETWWAKGLMCLGIIAVLAGVAYTIVYIRAVNRQRRELLDKLMEVMRERDVNSSDDKGGEVDTPEVKPLVPEQTPADAAFLDRVSRYVESNLDNPDANVDDMAVAAAASRSTLNRRLRSLLGVSAAQLIIEARMRHALLLLDGCSDEDCPVAEVARRCGYSDTYYFQRVFKKHHGVSPAEYRGKKERST